MLSTHGAPLANMGHRPKLPKFLFVLIAMFGKTTISYAHAHVFFLPLRQFQLWLAADPVPEPDHLRRAGIIQSQRKEVQCRYLRQF